VIDPHLQEGEKPIWSIGSQAGMSGVVTNHNRVIGWRVFDTNSHIARMIQKECTNSDSGEEQSSCYIVPPQDSETGEMFVVTKAAFGHRNWFAIGPTRKLYWIELNKFPGIASSEYSKSKAMTINMWCPVPNTGHLKIVDVDSGTNHSGFVTDDGDVYTWGDGNHGCLGHGSECPITSPTRVEYFKENRMKAVAIGCGGYSGWRGGFTIVLLDDNRLFYFGKLGNAGVSQLTPSQVVVPNSLILNISAGEDWAGIVTSKK